MREVAAAVGLAEGERGVNAVLSALARLEPVSIRKVSRATELPVPIVASICGELRKRAVVADERPAQLTPAGRALFGSGSLTLLRGNRGGGVSRRPSTAPSQRLDARPESAATAARARPVPLHRRHEAPPRAGAPRRGRARRPTRAAARRRRSHVARRSSASSPGSGLRRRSRISPSSTSTRGSSSSCRAHSQAHRSRGRAPCTISAGRCLRSSTAPSTPW